MKADEASVAVEETAAPEAAKPGGLGERVRSGLTEAQRGLQHLEQQLEAGAQQALATLSARTAASRTSVNALLGRVEQESDAALGAVGQKVAALQEAARKQLEGLSTRLVEGAGFASQHQVRALRDEMAELSRKLDVALTASKKPARSEGRAA